MERLRVVTLNIWHRSGPWPDRRRLIQAELGRLKPEIVGLQEVLRIGSTGPWTSENDQATELVTSGAAPGAGLPYKVCFGPASNLGGELWLGNALLSAFPVLESESIALPSVGDDFGRAVLFARIATPGAPTPVFVTHLSYRPEQTALRVLQAQAILAEVERRHDPGSRPALLMGDFNATPESEEMRVFTGPTPESLGQPLFVDAWSACSAEPGYTFDERNGFAAPLREPSRRIDYLLVENRVVEGPRVGNVGQAHRVRPTQSELVFTEPQENADFEKVWASDHYGVMTDLVLGPSVASEAN